MNKVHCKQIILNNFQRTQRTLQGKLHDYFFQIRYRDIKYFESMISLIKVINYKTFH